MLSDERLEHIKTVTPGITFEQLEFCGQISLKVEIGDLKRTVIALKELGFILLMDLTGVDYLEPQKYCQLVYFLHNPENLERVRLVVHVRRDVVVPTVTDLWEGAAWYERELFDLFGVVFAEHKDLKRILMPDDWVGHPMRRDYALTEEPVQFKHGVKPKVPSKIIPYVQINKKS